MARTHCLASIRFAGSPLMRLTPKEKHMLTETELEGLANEDERNIARAFAAAFDHLPPQRALEFIAYMRALWVQKNRRAFRVVKAGIDPTK